ncbi:YetF domain-containing protein [Azospirillum sp. BE72]|uniref:DUF421 domain-containing protein n=1 Tax=Azospirillum sp. BE72 TaxID=2817776 RepID=UPI0028543DD3|nr:YetF domain-containing protein [Azospirillum sp. BE72]MDR6775591.1 uncharacterized membrane protein YcaP (DUF421 family) [Azospirillum sp. BE72]
MESVLHAATMYIVLLVLFRISGRRTLAEASTFDFVLLLIISEATQQAMTGSDYSMTNALLVISTLILLDVLLTFLLKRFRGLDKAVNGLPLIVVSHGRPLRERMASARVDEDDILEAARRTRGLERLEQIKFAVLERSGGISIIPFERP